MICIENVNVFGWESAIRGMRNPMNSWEKSDSHFDYKNPWCWQHPKNLIPVCIGENDLALMKKLVKAGSDHRKFMRYINVTCDIVAPLYWWKEFDTYKIGTVANSCSTMHKITSKEFTIDDFSHDHMLNVNCLAYIIQCLNSWRVQYLETKDKLWWWQIVQTLPTSYNQRRTVQMNYEVLRNIYHARKEHKLDEWRTFCKWIDLLPYSELITEV